MFNVTTTVNYVNQCLFNNIATFSRLNNNLNPFKRKSLKFDNWMNINSNYGVVLHPFLVPIICFLFPDVSFKRWNDETWSMMLNVINQITEQNRSTKSGWKGFWARFGKATDNETTKGKYLEAEKWTNNEHVNVTDRPHEYVDSSTGFRSYQFQSFSHQSFAFPHLSLRWDLQTVVGIHRNLLSNRCTFEYRRRVLLLQLKWIEILLL